MLGGVCSQAGGTQLEGTAVLENVEKSEVKKRVRFAADAEGQLGRSNTGQ